MVNELFRGYPAWFSLAITLSLALAVAYALAVVAGRLARVALLGILGGRRGEATHLVRKPLRVVRWSAFVIVFALLLVPAVELAGHQLGFGPRREAVLDWLLAEGLRIVVVATAAWLLTRVIAAMLARFEDEVRQGEDAMERTKRIRTLGTMVRKALAVVIWGAASLMVLRELHVDIMPLLTGAGIVGLAIGFGAQTLVKDVISGFFLILENQVRVGDVAVINGTGGLVEELTLRTIVLRDLEGTVHVFPNGSVTTLANRTKDYSYALLDVSVAYEEDTDKVSGMLRAVAETMTKDEAFGPGILEPLEVLGVEALGESGVTIRVRMKTVPLQQWATTRELRRRVKQAFDAHGVQIPFPQRTVRIVQETVGSEKSAGAGSRSPRPGA
jgi:small conductance mechanosensitive channel